MPKLLTIQIPQPCGEDPAGMLPAANGNYCNSCKKEVIDFTGMSDSKLAAFFNNNPEGVCGRFYPDQLDKAIPLPKKQLPWAKYFFTIALPAFLLSLKSTAQQKSIPASHILSEHKFHTAGTIFTGKVVDQKGEPVDAASVRIQNSGRGTITDENGVFEIAIQPGDLSICISDIGFLTKEISIIKETANIILERSVKDLDNVTVQSAGLGIRREPMTLGGAVIRSVSVTTTVVSRQKVMSQQKKSNEINIYPNPIRSGSELYISWKDKVQTDQLVEIFSADGRLMQKETIRVTGKISACSFVLENLHPGFYIFMAIDTKTGTKTSREFIVE